MSTEIGGKQQKPNINVTMSAAATENMPSGTATKPGDVLKSMSGKTIEVEITDAEAKPVNDPVYARALALGDGTNTAVLVSAEAVAIAEIGSI